MAGLNQVLEFLSTLKNVPWGKVSGGDLQKWIDDPQCLANELQKFLKNFPQEMVAETPSESILRCLSEDETITIAACDGSRYIAKEKGVFKALIEGFFTSWGLDKRGKPTAPTNVSVHEMVEHATYVQMFASLSEDLDKLCLTQHQIIEFCKKHLGLLRANGHATFFLFKEDNQFYVADVSIRSGGLGVHVHRLKEDNMLSADYARRVVVPQLTI